MKPIPRLALFLACALSLPCGLAAQNKPKPAASPTPTAAPAESPDGSVVKKTLEDFAGRMWTRSTFSSASGNVTGSDEKAPDTSTEKSMRVEVNFSGNGSFEHFSANAPKPLYVPGDVRTLTVRIKRDATTSPRIVFNDGWGRGAAAGKEFVWDPKLTGTDWQTVTFTVPKDWVRPVGIVGMTIHNFSSKTRKVTSVFSVDDITAETDISGVDAATGLLQSWVPDPNPEDKTKALKEAPATPLQTFDLSMPEQGNVFAATAPVFSLKISNWKPGPLAGKAEFTLTDQTGKTLKSWEQAFSVESTGIFTYPVDVTRYGLYTISTKLTLSDSSKIDKKTTFARVPVLPELTEAQKLASPYGINYHGGGERLFETFKKAGFIWFRDYAFGLETMRRAKGPDHKYAGWPSYPAILADYDKLGLICLPVLFTVEPPVIKDGKVVKMGPDAQWIRDMADILISFPKLRYWELGNEYDLKPLNGKLETMVQWRNYQLYHQKFGELVSLLGDGQVTAVEQGRAGIYPVFVEEAVKSGLFDKIGVINSHHYTGTDAPEVNSENFNMGVRLGAGRKAGSFYDTLRMTKRAAQADGIKRQHWLTEFGWDTLAGPVVTPEQQAAYLQRGFLLTFAAGTDRSFWFYNFDQDEAKASHFFDGCGLLNHRHEPKLSFAAMAGLSSILPRPVYVGSINVGQNTTGYVFENDGKLVAGLWTIAGDDGPKATFKAEQLYDYFGNKLPGMSAQLKMAPVYAVGLDKSDPLYAQTAYSLESNYSIMVTAADTVETVVGVNNNRTTPIEGKVQLVFPPAWNSPAVEAAIAVPAGQQKNFPLSFNVSPKQELGNVEILVNCLEGGKLVKSIPLKLMMQRAFTLEVSPLEGQPGKTSLDVKIENKSTRVQNGKLSIRLPQSWQTSTPEIAITELKPGERRTVKVDLTWSADWKDNESAMAVFDDTKGTVVQAPIIPNRYRLGKAGAIKLDGNLSDWPKNLELPAWMLGADSGNADARLWFAWSPEGLYGAVEVKNSKGLVPNPKDFWDADSLELFLSTKSGKTQNAFEQGDHQFWFVPIFKENRVYAGQWKNKDEITENHYDLPGVKSAARRTDNGYIMEFFLPATAFQNYGLSVGSEIGFNANLRVRGASSDREVFWPRVKASGVNTQPLDWGRMKIVQ